MPGRRRTQLAVEADLRGREQLVAVGRLVKAARVRRRLSQAALGGRVGLSRMSISRAERGLGGGLTVDAWQRIGVALGMPLVLSLRRDALQEPADAGHLVLQELALRVTRPHGYRGQVELRTGASDPVRSIDVALVDDAHRRLVVVECWNTIGDVGAAARSSDRKLEEAAALAGLRWGAAPHRVGLCWIVRATARNRALVGRYPEVFAARFPGSSTAWVRALLDGAPPPEAPGLVWASVDGQRLWAWRRASRR